MKLYEVPRNSYIKLGNGEVYFFDHIDGMYSYCKDKEGNVLHFAAWSEVEIVDLSNKKEGH